MKYLDAANQFKSLSSRAFQYGLMIERKEVDYLKKIELLEGEIFRSEERLLNAVQKKSKSNNLDVNIEYLKGIFGDSFRISASNIKLKLKSKTNSEKSFNEAKFKLEKAIEEFELMKKENDDEISHLNEVDSAKKTMNGIFFYIGDIVDCNDSEIRRILDIGLIAESFSSKRRYRKECVQNIFSVYKRVKSKTKIDLTDPSVNFQGFVKDVRNLTDEKEKSEKKIKAFNDGLDSNLSNIDNLKESLYRARSIMNSNTKERAFSEMIAPLSGHDGFKFIVPSNHFQMIREKKIKIEILKKISDQLKYEKKFSRDTVEAVNEIADKYMNLHNNGYQYWTVKSGAQKDIKNYIDSTQKIMESKSSWISSQISSASMLKISESDSGDPNLYIAMLIMNQKSIYMIDCSKLIMKEELGAIEYSVKKSGTSSRQKNNSDIEYGSIQSGVSLNVASVNMHDEDSLKLVGSSISNMHSSDLNDFSLTSESSNSAFSDSYNAMTSDGAISSVFSAISSSVSSAASSCSGGGGGSDSGGSDGGGGCD